MSHLCNSGSNAAARQLADSATGDATTLWRIFALFYYPVRAFLTHVTLVKKLGLLRLARRHHKPFARIRLCRDAMWEAGPTFRFLPPLFLRTRSKTRALVQGLGLAMCQRKAKGAKRLRDKLKLAHR